jgi:hypothetical protein
MRKTLTLLLLLLVGCSDEILVSKEVCGAPCAVVDGAVLTNDEALAATCRPGESVCDADKNVSCPGYVPPADEELCGGFIDDDCDPATKESDIEIRPYAYNNTCPDTELGVCKKSYMVCVDGEMVCDRRLRSSEVCDTDKEDEDCDGLVNERDPDMVFTVPLFRYDGEPLTVNVGSCRAGVARCVDGVQRYEGMILPRAEECGNDADDDCDGLTDEAEGQIEPRAFLLLIDYSGSMLDYRNAVEQALCDWSISRPGDFFGIGGFGAVTSQNIFEYTEIVPFTNAVQACQAMSDENPLAGGSEYAARAGLLFLEDNSWPTSDRNIIIFSDEELQYYSTTEEGSFIGMCSEDSIRLGIYTNPDVEYTFDPIVNGCGGWVEYLGSRNAMIDSLTAHFAGSCMQ